ncbi:MAG TPA: C4-type zinc ribbon domain-containing protein [Acidimicrobiia bacterium]
MTAGPDALEALLTLQEHDGALDRLAHRRETLPDRERVARAAGDVAVLQARARALGAQRDEIARAENKLDDEARSLHGKAAEVEAKMYSGSVSSPRELQAMQADVDQLRRHERSLENRELELMEAREPLDGALAQLDGQIAALQRDLADARAALESAEAAIDAEAADEQKLRDGVAGALDPLLVADYERRRARARGVGVARLVGDTCQGCHLSIPATEVDRIRKTAPATVSYCDNCGAILVP